MEVPVKVEHRGSWQALKMDVGETAIVLGPPLDMHIQYKSIVDLSERGNVLILTVKGSKEESLKIASVEQVRTILKRMLVQNCSAYRLNAFFISPAIRGGVLNTSAKWEKGAIAVLRSTLWFANQHKQVCIPLTAVTGIQLEKKDVQGKPTDVIRVDHLEGQDLITSFVLCPLSTLQVLLNYLQESMKDREMRGGELDPVSSQVAMLIYSGMDSHGIENMLSLTPDQLDAIFEKLLKTGTAEVVFVRRELQLTPKGVRFISEALKSSTN
ncbi:MAG: CheF family chemotaxis protein [Methanomicrobiales archaeon]|nr:CheF family chemotaxis protein [Methanomicrobiales archaeon]